MEKLFDHLVAEVTMHRFGPSAHYRTRSRRLVTPSGTAADLDVLRRRLEHVDPNAWRREVESHIGAVARAEAELGRHSLADWGQLRDRIGLRLEVGTGSGRIGTALGPGLWALVIAVFEHLTVPIFDHHSRIWARPPGDVVTRARHNTITAPAVRHLRPLRSPDMHATLTIIQGGPFTSGLVVAPERVEPENSRSPFLLVAPEAHTLLAIAPSKPSPAVLEHARALLGSLAAITNGVPRHDDPRPILHHRAGEFAIFTFDTDRRDDQM